MTHRLTAKAEDDLIVMYVEGVRSFGTDQAESYFAEMEKTFRFLSNNPRAAPERPEIAPGLRVHPHREHAIIYTVDQAGDVLVIRVRHRREGWI